MKHHCTILAAVSLLLLGADTPEQAKAKSALQELNDYIGTYKAVGSPDRSGVDPKDTWVEKLSWRWRFKGNDGWLRLEIEQGKLFRGGELRFVPARDVYELTLTPVSGHPLTFTGKLRNGYLTLDHTDPASQDVQRLKMNTAGDGSRFIYTLERKRAGRTIFAKDVKVECSKEGESLAGGGGKKPECVVTGGLGTTALTYQGATYYVCCSGCREAFLENPEKFIKEFKAKKK